MKCMKAGRYDRQIPLIGKSGQSLLKDSEVFIAGAGGLGSPVATYLALAGVGKIRIADKDIIEITNLNRQFLHKTKNLGIKKAISSKDTILELNPDVKVEPICIEINEDNVKEIIGNCDIVIDALDNDKTREVISKYAVGKKIPLVHGSIHGFYGEVSVFIPGKENSCPFCIFDFLDETKKEEKTPVIGAVAGIIGSIQALEVIKYITNSGDLLTGKLMIWNGKSCTTEVIEFEKDPNCKYCGNEKK